MDRIKETAFIIKQLNRYNRNKIQDCDFIKSVCSYYDYVKDLTLNEFDYTFLKYISNKSGIPLYFDMLKRFSHNSDFTSINLQTFSSLFVILSQ